MKKLWLNLLAFFLIFSGKINAAVGTAPNGYNFDNHRQYILANQLREDTNSGIGLTSNVTVCNSNNGLVSFDFKADFLDSTKSYIVEIPFSMSVVSNAPITGTPSTFYTRSNTRDPLSPSAFDTQTIGAFNTDAVNSVLSNGYYSLYYNLSVYLLVTPNNSGSTSKRLQLGDYSSTATSNTLFNMVNFSNCSGSPNATATLRQGGFNYIEVDDSQVVSQPLLLMYLIESVKNTSQGSAADLTTIEAALQAISSSISTTNTNLSGISNQLSTIAGNQVTMNDNMVDYIEDARDTIAGAIANQTTSINTAIGSVNSQISNSASSINSQISSTGQSISTGIGATNSNLQTIQSQLNTIAGNQTTANDNLIDYLDLIIQNQQSSSGTIDYQYQQQTAQNTGSINTIFSGFQADYEDDDVDGSVSELTDFFNQNVSSINQNGGGSWTGNNDVDSVVNSVGISGIFRSLFARNLPGEPYESLNCEVYGAVYHPEIPIVKDQCTSPICQAFQGMVFTRCTREEMANFHLTDSITLLTVWDMFWWMIVIWRIAVDVIHTFEDAINIEKEDKLTIMEI